MSGITATCLWTNGRRATFWTWFHVCASTGTPFVQDLIGAPRRLGEDVAPVFFGYCVHGKPPKPLKEWGPHHNRNPSPYPSPCSKRVPSVESPHFRTDPLMDEDFRPLDASMRRKLRDIVRIVPRVYGFLWIVTPELFAISCAIMVVTALIPAAIIYTTKVIVDGVVATASGVGHWTDLVMPVSVVFALWLVETLLGDGVHHGPEHAGRARPSSAHRSALSKKPPRWMSRSTRTPRSTISFAMRRTSYTRSPASSGRPSRCFGPA